jgi:small multidrug resistance family-3 protein
LLEIGGGYLVWKYIREINVPVYYAFLGSTLLVAYGFIVTLQPVESFGRVYAAYGAIFIVMSCAWGSVFDDLKLDKGDIIGSLICMLGACVILFYPRDDGGGEGHAEVDVTSDMTNIVMAKLDYSLVPV